MEDIERLKQIAKKENAEWLGLSNIEAINNIVKEYTRLKYEYIPYLKGKIKGYEERIEDLKVNQSVIIEKLCTECKRNIEYIE